MSSNACLSGMTLTFLSWVKLWNVRNFQELNALHYNPNPNPEEHVLKNVFNWIKAGNCQEWSVQSAGKKRSKYWIWDLCWQRSWENALKRKKMIGHLLFLIQVQKFLRVLKTQSAASCQVFEGAGCSLLCSQGCRHTRINNYMLLSLHNSCKNEFFFFFPKDICLCRSILTLRNFTWVGG